MPVAIPWKFAANINFKENKFELDFLPCKEEFELFSLRYVLRVWGKLFEIATELTENMNEWFVMHYTGVRA